MTTKRDRKQDILDSALHVAERDGYLQMTRQSIAEHAQVSEGLVSAYYGTMCRLRRTVMRHAVKREVLPIIAQGLVMNDKHAQAAPLHVRAAAAEEYLT